MPEITDVPQALARLRSSKTIAVLGASATAHRPAHYVPEFLAQQGYRVIPINPRYAGSTLFGETVLNSLADVNERVDLVDVFRKAGDLPAHLPEFLAMEPLPGLVWFQQGIIHPGVAGQLVAAGIDVVQDMCTLALLRSAGA